MRSPPAYDTNRVLLVLGGVGREASAGGRALEVLDVDAGLEWNVHPDSLAAQPFCDTAHRSAGVAVNDRGTEHKFALTRRGICRRTSLAKRGCSTGPSL